MTLYGCDISNFQRGFSIANAIKQNYGFFIAKCTEGQSYQDPSYTDFLAQAKANKTLFGAYHFLHSDSTVQAQAENLAAHIVDKTIPVHIDCEPTGASKPTLSTLDAFANACKTLGLDVVDDYYPPFWWAETGSPSLTGEHRVLWKARYLSTNFAYGSELYPGDASPLWDPQGGVTPTILQFASTGKLDGFGGPVDVDAMRETAKQAAASGLFKNFDPAAPPPARVTPVQEFHEIYKEHDILAMYLLQRAIARGHTGTVKKVYDEIVTEVKKLPAK